MWIPLFNLNRMHCSVEVAISGQYSELVTVNACFLLGWKMSYSIKCIVLRIKMSLSPLPDHVMPAWYLKSLQFIIPTADAVPGYGASAENDGKKKICAFLEGNWGVQKAAFHSRPHQMLCGLKDWGLIPWGPEQMGLPESNLKEEGLWQDAWFLPQLFLRLFPWLQCTEANFI